MCKAEYKESFIVATLESKMTKTPKQTHQKGTVGNNKLKGNIVLV